tara:strand:- start:4601 stop:4855 length:255 start_codon:yes stop_codon:yes gene_type:complete
MNDKVYWTMSNGHKINVDDMSESHLRNTLKMLIRKVDSLSIRRATRREFVVNGDMAREDADNYNIYKATGLLPDDFDYDMYGEC